MIWHGTPHEIIFDSENSIDDFLQNDEVAKKAAEYISNIVVFYIIIYFVKHFSLTKFQLAFLRPQRIPLMA